MGLCLRFKSWVNPIFYLVVVRSMVDCMETCPKMQEARVPYTDNMEQLQEVMDMVSDIVMVPDTQFRYPHTVGTMVWGTHTDVEEEGTWVNYYTKERVDQEIVDNAIGGVSTSRMSNCAIVGSIFNGWIDWKCLLARNIFQKHSEERGFKRIRVRSDLNISGHFWMVPQSPDSIYCFLNVKIKKFLLK